MHIHTYSIYVGLREDSTHHGKQVSLHLYGRVPYCLVAQHERGRMIVPPLFRSRACSNVTNCRALCQVICMHLPCGEHAHVYYCL